MLDLRAEADELGRVASRRVGDLAGSCLIAVEVEGRYEPWGACGDALGASIALDLLGAKGTLVEADVVELAAEEGRRLARSTSRTQEHGEAVGARPTLYVLVPTDLLQLPVYVELHAPLAAVDDPGYVVPAAELAPQERIARPGIQRVRVAARLVGGGDAEEVLSDVLQTEQFVAALVALLELRVPSGDESLA